MISSFITESPDYYTQGDIGPIVCKISSVKKSKISIIMLAGSLGVDITDKLDVKLNYVLREWIKKDSAPLKSKLITGLQQIGEFRLAEKLYLLVTVTAIQNYDICLCLCMCA